MKTPYVCPVMEILRIRFEDVLTTSGMGEGDAGWETGDMGDGEDW